MPAGVPSEAAGPAFLSIFLAAAFIIAWRRRATPSSPEHILPAACLALGLQSLHVTEEFATGFHRHVPLLMGVEPWSGTFFVAFNLAWIAIWCAALGAIAARRVTPLSLTPLWFLAIAMVGNAIWHPLLSLLTGGYFPGLWTASPMIVAGPLLLGRLLNRQDTRPEGAPA